MPNLYTLQPCTARVGNDPDGAIVCTGAIRFSDGERENWGGSFDCGHRGAPFLANERYSIWHGGKHVFDIRALGAEDDSGGAVFAGIGPRPLEEEYE